MRTRSGGYYIQPTIFADVAPTLALRRKKSSGRCWPVIKSKSFEERSGDRKRHGVWPHRRDLFQLARAAGYGARDEFHVGNLYLNRKCTGPWWARIRLADST